MKKYIILILVIVFGFEVGFSQDEETQKKTKDRPVTNMFDNGLLMDDQTSVIPAKKSLEMIIQHRFGLIKENGVKDLFGIYAPSANTRMGLNYSILDNLMVGYGITRKNMYSDFQVKWAFLRQTRKNTIPLTVAVYANMAIDGRNESYFGEDYEFANRFSYFSQLIVGRKFNDWFSLELTASFTHYNAVESEIPNVIGYDHDVVGFGGHARFKFSSQSSFVISYTKPVYINSLSENYETLNSYYSNFCFGYEVATATHAFQIFFGTANGIIPQDIYMYNNSDWTQGEFRIGFNITRLWEF
ncbi:MAG: hypothetical protein C0591_01950 [Marinilabiliales bacterium]|nr:MAG: hypothetical protein C0591_01950 [Marinilabiliales bacterium]